MLKKIYIALSAVIAAASLFFLNGWNKLWAIAVFVCSLAAITLLHFVFALASSFFLKKEMPKSYARFCWWFLEQSCDIILDLCRVKVNVTGGDKLPKESRFLFVCNHRSNLDPIVVLSLFKGLHLAFICKPEVFKIPAAGPYLRRCGFTDIDRQNARNALVTINAASEMLKSGDYSVGVYPEGTRSKEGILLPFHDGVFKIAQKAGVPIVVASIDGTEKVKHRAPVASTEVKLNILGVLESEPGVRVRSHDLADAAREMITASLYIPAEQVI